MPGDSGAAAWPGVGGTAVASLRPAPRPRASVARSSVTSDRVPFGRKEKRLLRKKRASSPGAAILPAHSLLGQANLHLGSQVGLQTSARARASARPQEPRPAAGPGGEAEPEAGALR